MDLNSLSRRKKSFWILEAFGGGGKRCDAPFLGIGGHGRVGPPGSASELPLPDYVIV